MMRRNKTELILSIWTIAAGSITTIAAILMAALNSQNFQILPTIFFVTIGIIVTTMGIIEYKQA